MGFNILINWYLIFPATIVDIQKEDWWKETVVFIKIYNCSKQDTDNHIWTILVLL